MKTFLLGLLVCLITASVDAGTRITINNGVPVASAPVIQTAPLAMFRTYRVPVVQAAPVVQEVPPVIQEEAPVVQDVAPPVYTRTYTRVYAAQPVTLIATRSPRTHHHAKRHAKHSGEAVRHQALADYHANR